MKTCVKGGIIRNSTEGDIYTIHQWLQTQDKNGVHGSFLCNWNLTLEAHHEKNLLVYIESKTNEAIAYLWGSLTTIGILEVREDKRGCGIGRAFVEHSISQAVNSDACVLKIQCAPSTSIPFWEHLGFTIYDIEYSYAYMLLAKEFQLPENGVPISVEIKFYPNKKQWSPEVEELFIFNPKALKTPDGVIHLGYRVCTIKAHKMWEGDVVIGVYIDGIELYLEKAKYPEAKNIGVNSTPDAFFIEKIYTEV